MDWIISIVSIAGVVLNIYKNKVCFILWTVTNGYWCIYDYVIGAKAQSALFFIYFILALWGLYQWRNDKQEEKK